MHLFFNAALHIFVIAMVISFVTGSLLALTGGFDHWGSRYNLKARRKRLIRQAEKTKSTHQVKIIPIYKNQEFKPLRDSINHFSKVA